MRVVVNGDERDIAREELTIRELLEALHFSSEGIAVAVNDAVVPRAEHSVRRLHEGDTVEVIHAVAGG